MKYNVLKVFGLAVVALSLCETLRANDTAPEKVRVGFFEFDGYHMVDKEGVRSGYGYDLLQMLRPYLNCEYTYVGYENGWSDMLPMLERGEIDFVTSAVSTPEKLAKFDYVDTPIGFSSVIMTVKPGQCQYKDKDYANWSGIRVGMIANNSKNDVFARFAKDKKFTFVPVYFRYTSELHDALQSGNVDAIVTGSLRKIKDELVYEQIDTQPFYAIVKKGNKAMLNRLNEAFSALAVETPGFAGELKQLYYGHWVNNMSQVALTPEEMEFVRQCKRAGRSFSVLIQPETSPFEYLKDGEPCGIFVDIAKLIAQKSGLKFELVVPKDSTEYRKFRSEHTCDLIMGTPHDFQWAEQQGYILTKPYYPARTTMVFKKKSLGDVHIVGTLEGSVLQKFAEVHKPEGVTIVTLPSNKALIEAVQNDQIDGAYVLGPMADFVIFNDRTGQLTQERSSRVIDYSVAISVGRDAKLVSIIAKCVNALSKQEIAQVSRKNNLMLVDSFRSFREWVRDNPISVFLTLSGIALFMGFALVGMFIYHRRAEKAAAQVAKISRMWKALLDTLPVHVFAKDVVEFRHFFCNRERGNFFAKTPQQLTGVTDYDYLPTEFAQKQEAISRELAAHPDQTHEQTFYLDDAHGRTRYLRVIQKSFKDEDGTQLLLGCAIDLTDLENTRLQAQENSEWFQKTLISIGDGVLTTDKHGNITLLNPVAEKMLGTMLDECKGKPHTEYFNIVSYLDGEPVKSPVERCLGAGEIVTLANHTDLISKNGQRYHIADSAAPIRGRNGKIAGAILVFRDVTREYDLRDKLQVNAIQLENALAQAQHASAAKGTFLSQMSHEIRTPLNAVIGYLSIAKDCDRNMTKIDECIQKSLEASSHLLSIINDILDVSSIESGKLKIAHDDFDFKHLLTGIVSMFYHQAERQKIRFEMGLRDLTEEWLVGDSLRVNQILLNLLSNALKFTPEGGSITLNVKQLAIVRNRVQLRIEVADTGCGMSEEFKERLFLPFEQQDASTARKFGGTGLGLSITKNLVTMMGGTIEVQSKENEGTVFTVNLSFDRSEKMQDVAEADFSKLRALIVDDKEEDRTYIQMVLKKCGVKSDAVASGEVAVDQLKLRLDSRHPYDLCLLDMRLPGINGLETAKQIRQMKTSTSDLPLVLLTAYDTTAFSGEAHEAGVNRIIQKPLFQSTFFDFLMSYYYCMSDRHNAHEIKQGLNGLKILLVEDNQMNMDISTQYLERAGMKIIPAWNGQEAVDKFTTSAPGTFQAILMDIQMPIMDGYQATVAIRASSHPEAKTIPIIAMTANAFNEDIVKALSAGMNDHISKPVFYDRLFESLSKLINKEDGIKNGR